MENVREIVSKISRRADELLREKEMIIIAIDGRCASGKTTVGEALAEKYGATLVHMDDFFLRPEQRTKERLTEPGGNVDRERFLDEVLLPLSRGEAFSYRPYDCSVQSLRPQVKAEPARVNVVEGSYCCHPDLYGYYDMHVFLDVDAKTQRERISSRSPEKFETFIEKWIPLEEKYFSYFKISEKCELVLP
ncbi:MAG: uridine kinase family protein [Eubacterium sp.]|jgi:uridine kinase